MLDIMVNEQEAGKMSGSREEICRVVGCTEVELEAFLDENKAHRFADVTFRNKKVTIICRRLYRLFLARHDTKIRVQRYREKRNANVTPPSSSSSSYPYSPLNGKCKRCGAGPVVLTGTDDTGVPYGLCAKCAPQNNGPSVADPG
jgi:hypothetical protein